jgi:hypothetical protein
MALEKIEIVDRIEVLEKGCVQVRTATRIVEDGEVISESFHRHVITPGADFSGDDDLVQVICKATHTSGVISAYESAAAFQGA